MRGFQFLIRFGKHHKRFSQILRGCRRDIVQTSLRDHCGLELQVHAPSEPVLPRVVADGVEVLMVEGVRGVVHEVD